jgi:hypothetical protein
MVLFESTIIIIVHFIVNIGLDYVLGILTTLLMSSFVGRMSNFITSSIRWANATLILVIAEHVLLYLYEIE